MWGCCFIQHLSLASYLQLLLSTFCSCILQMILLATGTHSMVKEDVVTSGLR